jgi:hypothetical protein
MYTRVPVLHRRSAIARYQDGLLAWIETGQRLTAPEAICVNVRRKGSPTLTSWSRS